MADAPRDPYLEGTANLRETAKWLVGGIVTVAVGVLAGSPLTNLGSLDIGVRLGVALAAAGAAYVVLGILLWKALGIIAADTISIDELARAKGAEGRAAKRIEVELEGQMPGGYATFADWAADAVKVSDDGTSGSEERYAAFTAEIIRFKPRLGFEYKRDRFVRLRRLTIALTPFVIMGVGIFAWAANPPSEQKPLTDKPRFSLPLVLGPREAAALSPALTASCYPVDASGRVQVAVMVLSEFPGGRTELATLPAVQGCQPFRITQQNGRFFLPK